jgi:methylphosphotriester-DNA--protein-cysteine methyltransferase
MIKHSSLGNTSFIRARKLLQLIKEENVAFSGNSRLKIYGLLNCKSGKRMRIINRVFFSSAKEAVENGFRPCGHCMPVEYKKWKQNAAK